jgi:hypothetical protein
MKQLLGAAPSGTTDAVTKGYVDAADAIRPPLSVSSTAPSSPNVGDLWVAVDAGPATANFNFAVAANDPALVTPGMWVQTQVGPAGQDVTFWIEDGL